MRINIFPGETLLTALQRIQVHIDAPCNGNGTCGKCKAEIYGIGMVNACQFKKSGTYEVQIQKQQEFQVVTDSVKSETENEMQRNAMHLDAMQSNVMQQELDSVAAIDLGTTTVAIRSFMNGQSTDSTFMNPQRQYGADVMSRIRAAVDGQEKELQRLSVAELQKSIGNVSRVIVSANTTMQHLLQGLSCEGLGQAPFTTVDISLHEVPGEQIRWNKDMTVTFLPGISAYVGADIVSGIYELGMAENDKVTLLVDLGTNGEMALGNRDKLMVASASAGPAFEGSEIAQRIYGSGIMKLLHELLDQKIMDETGYLPDENKEQTSRILKSILPQQEENGRHVDITQDEIRDIQMAKAAIHAGIEILLKEYGISPEQVDKIYLAGGMGYYLDPEDAIAIGLLPAAFRGRISSVGNTSLKGAIKYAQNTLTDESAERTKQELNHIVAIAKEIVFANHPMFEERYIGSMNFPIKNSNTRPES